MRSGSCGGDAKRCHRLSGECVTVCAGAEQCEHTRVLAELNSQAERRYTRLRGQFRRGAGSDQHLDQLRLRGCHR